ncbi:MAG: MFS transporter [Bacilli bacterium]|nr:MFS transporter [Bacilli bacterium]
MAQVISRKTIAEHSGINWKDILFYCFGDFGNCLVFACANVLLNKYYTSCLMFNPAYIIIIFAIARIWDAVNDPIMGRIADGMKPHKKRGKFKRWFLYISIPYAVATILMFCQFGPTKVIDGYCAAPWQYILAGFTYILFGMCMTAIQIPYGSLASVVTLDSKERSKLSIARGVAGNIGGMPVLAVKALAFKTNEETGGSVVDFKPLIIGVAILAAFAILFMLLCYKGSKERWIPEPAPKEKGAFKKAIGRITHSRSMLSICVISVIVAGGGMFKGVITPFISADFFGYDGVMTILPDIFDCVGIAVTMFLVPVISKRMGKKESSAAGLYFAALVNAVMMLIFFMVNFDVFGEAKNATAPYMLYVVGNFLSGLGSGFFNCLLWGMAADAIDEIQINTGIREDGTSYSIMMFSRKIGQTIAFCGGQGILLAIGFTGGIALDLQQKTALWFVAMGTVIACYALGAILFTFWYPIDKSRLEEIQDEKEIMLATAEKKKITAHNPRTKFINNRAKAAAGAK